VSAIPWRITTRSGLDDWLYSRLLCTVSLNYNHYSAIADLHTFQFTVAHALGFSVSTSRLLATDLNTGTITSNHYEVVISSSIILDCRLTKTRPNSPIQSLRCCIPIPLVLDSVPLNARLPLYTRGTYHAENTSTVVWRVLERCRCLAMLWANPSQYKTSFFFHSHE
jgi:hypothetical protein